MADSIADVAVIGAGIAGCMAAHQIQKTGASVVMIERHPAVAMEASGNPWGLVMPQLVLAPSPAAIFNAAAYQSAIGFYQKLPIEMQHGVLQLARNQEDAARFARLAQMPMPDRQMLDAGQASDMLGLPTPHGALWFPHALMLSPRALCEYLSRDSVKYLEREALRLERQSNCWRIMDRHNQPIVMALKVVVANAADALRLPQMAHLKLRLRRGQLTFLKPTALSAKIQCNFTFGGYMTKALNGTHTLGATYETPLEDNAQLTDVEHTKNLEKLSAIIPALAASLAANVTGGRAAVRATTPDHQPIYGQVENEDNLYVLTGLGSRALTTAYYCAEQIVRTFK